MIPNALINDEDLSTQARFLFVYLSSKPDDWSFYQKPICKNFGWSADTFRKYVKELAKSGWICREQNRDENNRFKSYQYTLNQEPVRKISEPNLDKEVLETKKDDDKTPPPHLNQFDDRIQQPQPLKANKQILTDCAADGFWRETICSTSYIGKRNLTESEFDTLLNHFYQINTAEGKRWHTDRNFKSHFRNWLLKVPAAKILADLNRTKIRHQPEPVQEVTITEEDRQQIAELNAKNRLI